MSRGLVCLRVVLTCVAIVVAAHSDVPRYADGLNDTVELCGSHDKSSCRSGAGDPLAGHFNADQSAAQPSPTWAFMEATAVHLQPQHEDYLVVLHYRRAHRRTTSTMPNITLVSHATLDRLPAVSRWCKTFRGPMSISVFVRPLVDDIDRVMAAFVADECVAKHADLHLVREKTHVYDADLAARGEKGKDMMTHYPFNVQRNAALDGCVGDLALLMDIDFHLMPTPNTREVDLRRHLVVQQSVVASWKFLGDDGAWVGNSAVYIIPAVETMNQQVAIPRTTAELRKMVDAHSVLPFYHTCQTCHLPTDLRRFLRAADDAPYLVEFEEGYEPYVVVNRTSSTKFAPGHQVPRYDELFVGRGWDKMSFFYELATQRRPFVVMPKYFIVHHGKGDMPKVVTTEYMRRQEVNRALMGRFKEAMEDKYHHVIHRTSGAEGGGTGGSGGLAQQEPVGEKNILHSPNPGSGPTDTSTTSELDSRSQPRRVIWDSLLWRATEGIPWGKLSTTFGFPVRCTSKYRATNSPEAVEEMLRAAAKAESLCSDKTVDCSELQQSSTASTTAGLRASLGTLRDSPEQIDWVFERAMHVGMSRGGQSPQDACYLGGMGALIEVDQDSVGALSSSRSAARPGASETAEEGAEDSTNGANGGVESGEAADGNVMQYGCTLNRDVCVTWKELQSILSSLCKADPSSATSTSLRQRAANSTLARELCRNLFERTHELLRDDLRMRVSVALNAHHHVFYGVRDVDGVVIRTCGDRFGIAAVLTRKPDSVVHVAL